MPVPELDARKQVARLTPPLRATIDTGPGSRPEAELTKVAKVPSAGLTKPEVLGPSSLIPYRRAVRTASSWSGAPAGDSAKPPAQTTAARTPARPQSSIAAGTAAAGTVRMARSGGSVISPTVGVQG